jgi:hypothetical protein
VVRCRDIGAGYWHDISGWLHLGVLRPQDACPQDWGIGIGWGGATLAMRGGDEITYACSLAGSIVLVLRSNIAFGARRTCKISLTILVIFSRGSR